MQNIVAGRTEGEHCAHHASAGDQAKIARQPKQTGHHATLRRRNIRHDGGIVGRLEQRVTGGNDHQWHDVAERTEARWHGGQDASAGQHGNQSEHAGSMCAQSVDPSTRRNPGQCGDQRPRRHHQANARCIQRQCAGEIKRPHHQGGHDHGRHQHAHGETCAQLRIAEYRQSNQR
ncbi:hypothetical protein D3C78_1253510 [compost metagenome]